MNLRCRRILGGCRRGQTWNDVNLYLNHLLLVSKEGEENERNIQSIAFLDGFTCKETVFCYCDAGLMGGLATAS